MKVRLYAADESGCGFFRIREPARAAATIGVECDVTMEIPHTDYQDAQTGRWVRVPDQVDADVLVFQRPGHRMTVQLMKHLQQRGHAIVVDLDDDLGALDPRHPAWMYFDEKINPYSGLQHIREACRIADLVTVTTPALAERYAPHGRVAVLPNCVPASLLDLPHAGDGQTVGWGGSAIFHPGDLPVTRGGVQDALDRTGARFLQIGSPTGVRDQLRLRETLASTGELPISDYHHALGRLDVGIVPLADTRFNRAKSYLKGIEYAARGVPFVASPLPEYERLAGDGVGLLAGDRARTWRQQLVRLLEDDSLRVEMAEHGRERVREEHTFEGQADRWADAWHTAIGNRRLERAKAAA